MNAINFCGEVYDTSIEDILNILNKILERDKIKSRNKPFWDEINYEDENLEIYFESNRRKSNLTNKDKDEYQINGEFFTNDKDTAKNFLEKLGSLFLQQDIKYSFEYYEETEDGQQIGDGYMIEHPDL